MSTRMTCFVLALSALAPACLSQTPKSPVADDSVILVQPQGSQALVAVIFPKTVPKADVQSRMNRLARSAGWHVASLEIKDESLETNPLFGPSRSLGRQTGATALFTNAPQSRDGGFLLQPYIEAFRDLGRFDILFMVPPDPGFRGLREYENPAMSVRLVREGGPYRYHVEIRDHTGPLPVLPLTQSRPTEAPKTAATRRPTRSSGWSAYAPVMALAAIAGLLVFAALLVRMRLSQPRDDRRTGTKGMSNRA